MTPAQNNNFQTWILIAIGAVVSVGVAGAVLAKEAGTQTQIVGFSSLVAMSLLTLLTQIRTSGVVEQKLEAIGTDVVQTKEHTNAALGHALELTAISAQKAAEATGKAGDIEIARLAREASANHREGQQRADARIAADTSIPRKQAAVAKETKTMKEDVDVAVEQIVDTVEESGEAIKTKIDDIQ